MGNYVTKLLSHDDEGDKQESNATETMFEEKGMCTPLISRRNISIDPRSATVGIDRTPIQVDCTPDGFNTRTMKAIPRHLRGKTHLEGDINMVIPILTPKKRFVSKFTEECTPKKNNETEQTHLTPSIDTENATKLLTPIDIARYQILGLDPRSPAADFERTPILMPKSMEALRARSYENLGRRGSYEVDMYSKFSYCETLSPFSMTEIQALPDMAAQVLESLNLGDIDCDKTNESNSSCSEDSPIIKTVSKSSEYVSFVTNSELILDAILAEEKILTSGEKKLKNRDDIEMNNLKRNNCNVPSNEIMVQPKLIHTNDSDRIKVWRDSSSEETEDSKFIELDNIDSYEKKTDAIEQEAIITYDDNCIVKGTLPLKAIIGNNEYLKTEVIEKKKPIKPDIKIMGDDKKMFYSDTKNGNESPKTRTPLGNRSNNGKILTKSPQQLFRNRGIRQKMLQENTPPHKRGSIKSKLSSVEWDPDENVII